MYAYRTQIITNGEQPLKLELPPEFPKGRQRVEVVVTVVGEEPVTDIDDLLAWQKTLPPSRYIPEEIEAWINEERNAWGD
ncbi:MAG: hypothetical protein LBF51_04810 [Zoogloeaceae bacterium]|jgi:hypothetical protein|nr:hypothetical protein [Zoogloeaceae bacterium]